MKRMKMLNLDLETLISNAKKHGACKSHVSFLSAYETTQEALKDSKAPYWINWYLRNVVKSTDEECEAFLLKNDPRHLYHYIRFIKKERWEEGEVEILKSPEFSAYYAIYFLGHRWKEIETTIYDSIILWNMYAEKFGLEKQEEKKK